MGPCHSQSLILSLTLPIFLALTTSSSDHTALVFKGCADQNFNSQTIKHLLGTLISQSSTAKFHNATASNDGSFAQVEGLFQCRGDLSNAACEACVEKASSAAQRLCKQAVAARIQLNGCYLRYAASGFGQPGRTELLYRICGSGRAIGDRLDVALGAVVRGLESGNNGGFYAGGYESVYALGQCEGSLSGAECAECVRSAIERAKSECGSSISAQIYFQECYISYTYYPNGVPTNHKSLPSSESVSGRGRNTQKTVAIVMGGLVVVGLVMSCLLYTKSAFKKRAYNNNNNHIHAHTSYNNKYGGDSNKF